MSIVPILQMSRARLPKVNRFRMDRFCMTSSIILLFLIICPYSALPNLLPVPRSRHLGWLILTRLGSFERREDLDPKLFPSSIYSLTLKLSARPLHESARSSSLSVSPLANSFGLAVPGSWEVAHQSTCLGEVKPARACLCLDWNRSMSWQQALDRYFI